MATKPEEDDFEFAHTAGYNPGEKKALNEYRELDSNDEALNRWKASLGIGNSDSISNSNDPRTVIIHELALEVPGRNDVVLDLTRDGALEALKGNPFTIKEGAEYRMRVKFQVQHDIISGLKYTQVVKRMGIPVDKSVEMIGSFGPNTKDIPHYEKRFDADTAPSGMLARAHYDVTSRFTDDDKKIHLEFVWSFDIKKNWD